MGIGAEMKSNPNLWGYHQQINKQFLHVSHTSTWMQHIIEKKMQQFHEVRDDSALEVAWRSPAGGCTKTSNTWQVLSKMHSRNQHQPPKLLAALAMVARKHSIVETRWDKLKAHEWKVVNRSQNWIDLYNWINCNETTMEVAWSYHRP
jgi:hypothetical protein